MQIAEKPILIFGAKDFHIVCAAKVTGYRLTKGSNGDIDRYSTLLSQSPRSPWC